MPNPYDDLRDIQKHWKKLVQQNIAPVAGHKNISFFHDTVGELDCDRWIYIKEQNDRPIAIATLVHWSDLDGVIVLDLGYAVDPDFRTQGFAQNISQVAFSDIENHLDPCPARWFIEASVDVDNAVSQAIASKLLENYQCRRINPQTERESVIYRKEFRRDVR